MYLYHKHGCTCGQSRALGQTWLWSESGIGANMAVCRSLVCHAEFKFRDQMFFDTVLVSLDDLLFAMQ